MSKVLSLALLFCLTTGLLQAADKEAKKAKQSPVMALLKEAELTDEQKPKVEAVAKTFDPKLQENSQASMDLLTAEQKKARAAIQKKNRDGGVKGKEARAALDAALNLTAEQKEKTAVLTKQRTEILAQLRKELTPILTPEQLKKVPQLAEKKAKKNA